VTDSDEAEQKPIEEQTHVFIVKVWKETDPPGSAFWRGHITHIPSNNRVYIQHLADIDTFIKHYIQMPE
jgi:hypothetical protein